MLLLSCRFSSFSLDKEFLEDIFMRLLRNMDMSLSKVVDAVTATWALMEWELLDTSTGCLFQAPVFGSTMETYYLEGSCCGSRFYTCICQPTSLFSLMDPFYVLVEYKYSWYAVFINIILKSLSFIPRPIGSCWSCFMMKFTLFVVIIPYLAILAAASTYNLTLEYQQLVIVSLPFHMDGLIWKIPQLIII